MSDKQNIVEEAIKVFLQYGIRSVTMDDLSRLLSISKKTLYQHFTDKESLITAALETHRCGVKAMLEEARKIAQDPIQELLIFSQWEQYAANQVPPVVIFDLKKYHPAIWKSVLQQELNYSLGWLHENLERGIEQGLYRTDIPIDVVVRLYLAQREGMLQDYIFPDSSGLLADSISVSDDLFIRGIATAAGLECLLSYKQQVLPSLIDIRNNNPQKNQ